MTSAATAQPGTPAARPAGWLSAIAGLAVATAIAGGAGMGTAWLLQSGKVAGVEFARVPAMQATANTQKAAGAMKGLVARPVPTVITNLAGDRRAWVRAEFSVLLPASTPDVDALMAVIGQDVVGFLRGVTPAQIDGPQGMTLLREEIEDRVRVRTQGRSQGVLFKTFVIE